MPKTGKSTGPSLNDGTRPRVLQTYSGDFELEGSTSDLIVGGNVDAAGNITVKGTATLTGGVAGNLTVAGSIITGDGVTISNAITRDWAVDGWTGVTPVTITNDPGQTFTTSVSGSRGTVASAASAAGNHRVAYLLDNTTTTDAVMTSLINGPSHSWNGTNAQQGHIHRVRSLGGGLWEGIAVWTSIVLGGDYSYLHHAGVRFDGTTLSQSGAGGVGFGTTDSAYLDNQLLVRALSRSNVFVWVNDFYVAAPERVTSVQPGDLIAIAGLSDATFNEASIAVAATSANLIRVIEPVTTGAVAYTPVATLATITPTGVDAMKQWAPFWLSTRVIGGTGTSVTVEAKRWRTTEREPDWGDPRVQRDTVVPGGSVTAIAASAGKCALWTGHMSATSSVSWGAIRVERIR